MVVVGVALSNEAKFANSLLPLDSNAVEDAVENWEKSPNEDSPTSGIAVVEIVVGILVVTDGIDCVVIAGLSENAPKSLPIEDDGGTEGFR